MITLAGSPIASLGWFVEKTSGLEDVVTRGLSVATLPDRETSVVTSSLRPAEPRSGVLTLGVRADTESALQTAINALEAVCNVGDGIVLLSTRRPGQRLTVHVLGGPASPGIGPEFVAPFYLQYGLRVQAVDPWWEDASEQSVAFATVTAIPMGTADARGVITITASGGSVVNPVVTHKTGAGATIQTLSPTITIANGDAWRIDSVTQQVRKRVSGVWSNAIDTMAGSWTYPVYRRAYFTYGTNSQTLEVAGTHAAGTATHRRKYA